MVELLINKGADLTIREYKGFSALTLASAADGKN